MKLQEIMQAQIDSVMTGLARIRQNLPMASAKDELERIERDLDQVAFHLHDIRHNWLSLHAVNTPSFQTKLPHSRVCRMDANLQT